MEGTEERTEIREDETIEDLQLHGLKLIQKKKGFRFGMDAVLLADFMSIRAGDCVADFGCGTGILPVLLAGREKGSFYYGVDIQEELCEIAERNFRLNRLKGKVVRADLTKQTAFLPQCSLDAIICNPPYGAPQSSLTSPFPERAIARTQQEGTIDGFLKNAFQLLRGKGKIGLIYPAATMLSLLKALQEYHLEPKRMRMVHPTADREANLILIEAVKDAKPSISVQPPLMIRNMDGSLTNELKSIYHIENAT